MGSVGTEIQPRGVTNYQFALFIFWGWGFATWFPPLWAAAAQSHRLICTETIQNQNKIKNNNNNKKNTAKHLGHKGSKNDHAVNWSWRHLKLTNPLESAIPLGILQSKACSGQNKGRTVTKETAQLFSTSSKVETCRAEQPGTFRERIPAAHRSSCQNSTPTSIPGQSVSSSKTSGRFLINISYFGTRWRSSWAQMLWASSCYESFLCNFVKSGWLWWTGISDIQVIG